MHFEMLLKALRASRYNAADRKSHLPCISTRLPNSDAATRECSSNAAHPTPSTAQTAVALSLSLLQNTADQTTHCVKTADRQLADCAEIQRMASVFALVMKRCSWRNGLRNDRDGEGVRIVAKWWKDSMAAII